MENWLFAPNRLILKRSARYVAILLEMYQFCPTLRGEARPDFQDLSRGLRSRYSASERDILRAGLFSVIF
jgi:hypothetical protein